MAPAAGPVYHANGKFTRPDSTFRNFVSRNPSSKFPAEAGRYALYLTPMCPWAHRTLIVRKLKKLESAIDVYILHPTMGPDGWYFSGERGSLAEDPLHPGIVKLKQLYLRADPSYEGRYTVPVLWDKKQDLLVNNESSEILRMLASEFDDIVPEELKEANAPNGGLYPEALRTEIDTLNEKVYHAVNNGVYKVGFAKSQEAYDENITPLFDNLDELEKRLDGKTYLVGDHLTEADVRLYTTLARFDVAYNTVMQATHKTIRGDYPNLHLWFRRLYWDDGKFNGAFRDTTQAYLGAYPEGYAKSRTRIVLDDHIPAIVPKAPGEDVVVPRLSE